MTDNCSLEASVERKIFELNYNWLEVGKYTVHESDTLAEMNHDWLQVDKLTGLSI